MLRERAPQNKDVVQVHYTHLTRQTSEDCLHQVLESCRGVAQPKGHDPELKKIKVGRECGLLLRSLVHSHLPVPTG